MLFNTLQFAVFFVIVYSLYRTLGHAWQNRMLLVASYVFYGAWNWRFLFLVMVSTMLDYACGLRIHASNDQNRKRLFLVVSVAGNLTILGFFKYYNFFSSSLLALLSHFGLSCKPHLFDIILPLGISFYTFQTMSYTIDIYRGRMAATKRLDDFLLFVAFFPQLVAGPIERAKDLLPQIQAPRRMTLDNALRGTQLMLLGFFKKMVIADNMALLVDSIYDNPKAELTTFTIVLATYAFAFQIYADFSGYTDIARGAARILGFDLRRNFQVPYLATNPSDFWQRWHISLSSWLRDYLYIPLGGNRGGGGKTFRNLAVTMLLGGLWHGAAWNFVLWGAFHGILLGAFHQFVPRRKGREMTHKTRGGWRFWLKVFGFFQLTCVGWFLFRVGDLEQILTMGAAFFRPQLTTPLLSSLPLLLVFALPMIALDVYCYKARAPEPWRRWPVWGQVLLHLALFYGIVLYGTPHTVSFIYFQF